MSETRKCWGRVRWVGRDSMPRSRRPRTMHACTRTCRHRYANAAAASSRDARSRPPWGAIVLGSLYPTAMATAVHPGPSAPAWGHRRRPEAHAAFADDHQVERHVDEHQPDAHAHERAAERRQQARVEPQGRKREEVRGDAARDVRPHGAAHAAYPDGAHDQRHGPAGERPFLVRGEAAHRPHARLARRLLLQGGEPSASTRNRERDVEASLLIPCFSEASPS